MGLDEFDVGGEYVGVEMEGVEVGVEEVVGLRRLKIFVLVGLVVGVGVGVGVGMVDWKLLNLFVKIC